MWPTWRYLGPPYNLCSLIGSVIYFNIEEVTNERMYGSNAYSIGNGLIGKKPTSICIGKDIPSTEQPV